MHLAKYGIPELSNLHVRCICHVINLVAQAVLAELGEVDDPNEVDYFMLNKEQAIHLDIDTDPDQLELDEEEFEDELDDEQEESVNLEEAEKLKGTKSPLAKVCS